MAFERILGQPTAVTTLERALESGHAHHAYRFEGPQGVGKTLTALSFAQALVCHDPTNRGCGQCRACELTFTFSEEPPLVPMHPDVVLVGRGVYPPALLGRTTPETTGISVQQIRRIVLARAGFTPHEGRALCFIIKNAHELTISAANALLKTLEEPPPQTFFVLTTNQPGQLLDTIRSRTLAVRFAPLPDAIVRRITGEQLSEDVIRLAQGSVSTALELHDPDINERRQAFTNATLQAQQAPDFATALSFVGHKAEGRDELKRQLQHLAQTLADDALSRVAEDPARAARLALQHRVVLKTLVAVDKNAQPALLLESMIAELRAV